MHQVCFALAGITTEKGSNECISWNSFIEDLSLFFNHRAFWKKFTVRNMILLPPKLLSYVASGRLKASQKKIYLSWSCKVIHIAYPLYIHSGCPPSRRIRFCFVEPALSHTTLHCTGACLRRFTVPSKGVVQLRFYFRQSLEALAAARVVIEDSPATILLCLFTSLSGTMGNGFQSTSSWPRRRVTPGEQRKIYRKKANTNTYFWQLIQHHITSSQLYRKVVPTSSTGWKHTLYTGAVCKYL